MSAGVGSRHSAKMLSGEREQTEVQTFCRSDRTNTGQLGLAAIKAAEHFGLVVLPRQIPFRVRLWGPNGAADSGSIRVPAPSNRRGF